jgi:thiamine-phosphate pyrophosphorylase
MDPSSSPRELPFSLLLVTDRRQARGGLERAVESALDGGLKAVQLREKDLPARELFLLAERLRSLTDRYGALLLVNDRADVALACGADGVHLGAASIPPAEARRLLGPGRLVGFSAHSLREAEGAEAGGADYATFGPVWFTPSKAGYGEPVGTAALSEAARAVSIPLLALGGVTAARAAEALSAGAKGVALISAILAAEDPARATRETIRALAARGKDGTS